MIRNRYDTNTCCSIKKLIRRIVVDIPRFRACLDNRNETIGKKIREAELSKVPFMLILGEKEAKTGNVSVRKHREGDMGTMSTEAFVELIGKEVYKSISKFEN